MKPKRFCRIIESEEFGQILIRLDSGDNGGATLIMTVNMFDMYVSSITEFKEGTSESELLNRLDSITTEQCEAFAKSVSEIWKDDGE